MSVKVDGMRAFFALLYLVAGEAVRGPVNFSLLKGQSLTASTWIFAGAASVSIGLPAPDYRSILAETDLDGNLIVNAVYQPQNDIPSQRAALQEIYTSLGGDYWTSAYKQTAPADAITAFESNLPANSEL